MLVSSNATERRPFDLGLTLDYSEDSNHRLELNCLVENYASEGNYTYRLYGSHPATNLRLLSAGGIYWKPHWYFTRHTTDYKRTYLPLQSGDASALLDLRSNEIELKVIINTSCCNSSIIKLARYVAEMYFRNRTCVVCLTCAEDMKVITPFTL